MVLQSWAFQCTLHSKTRRSLPLFPSYRGPPVSDSLVDKERCSILCYQHLVLSDCYCSVFLFLGSAWRESGKWLHYSGTAWERCFDSKQPHSQEYALAGAPAQTAKVPTPFLFWEKKLDTGYRTMMKRFQEHHFSGENHLSALSHIDFALLLLSIASFIYHCKRAAIFSELQHDSSVLLLSSSSCTLATKWEWRISTWREL